MFAGDHPGIGPSISGELSQALLVGVLFALPVLGVVSFVRRRRPSATGWVAAAGVFAVVAGAGLLAWPAWVGGRSCGAVLGSTGSLDLDPAGTRCEQLLADTRIGVLAVATLSACLAGVLARCVAGRTAIEGEPRPTRRQRPIEVLG